MYGAYCVWCPDGCTATNPNKCEPWDWLDTQGNKKPYQSCLSDDCAPRKQLYGGKGCHETTSRTSCLTSLDGRGDINGLVMYGSACVWCEDGCTEGGQEKCQPKRWLLKQSNKKDYEYCLSVVPGTSTP